MNTTDRRIFGVFIALAVVGAMFIAGIAASMGDTPLAIFAYLGSLVGALIVADAFRYHGKHEA